MRNILLTIAVALVLASFLVKYAKSHSNPVTGISCCGSNDCFPIPFEDVEIVEGGYYIKSIKEFIPEAETLRSEDGHYRRCEFLLNVEKGVYDRPYKKGERRCFFAPMVGL